MAQRVGYFEDGVVYEEGPFVLTCITHNAYRIEVELKGHHCPVLMDPSVYTLLAAETEFKPGCGPKHSKELWVDWLNEQVEDGRIVLDGKRWVCPEYA